MDNLRFRAYDKKNNRMLFRGLHDKWWYDEEKRGKAVVRTKATDDTGFQISAFTQFTDKNEISVYGGDIIPVEVTPKRIVNLVVKFDPRWIGWTLQDNEEQDWFVEGIGWHKSDYEVIGNIYQNPELLEGGQS